MSCDHGFLLRSFLPGNVLIIIFLGRGVRTTRRFDRGDYLLTYFGSLITGEEGDIREEQSVSTFRYFFPFRGEQWW
jgi:hypothetical protein